MLKLEKIDVEIINNIERLINLIVKKIPGGKSITLVIEGEEDSPFVIDVSKDWEFNYHKSYLFKAKLTSAFLSSGGMIIRQIHSIKEEMEITNGRKIKVPVNRIYGVFINKGKWYPLSKEEVAIAYCTDVKTGRFVPPAPHVLFSDFPI